MDLGLAGRRAIVTGGSKGLGRAITAELMGEGASVVICSRHADELEAAAAELTREAAARGSGSGPVVPMACDVTNPEQVATFIDAAVTAMGGTHVTPIPRSWHRR